MPGGTQRGHGRAQQDDVTKSARANQ